MTELTRQQLEPIGTLESRPVWVSVVVVAILLPYAATLRALGELNDPLLAVLALVLTAVAGALVIAGTSVTLAPFTVGRHVAVHVLMIVVLVLALASEEQSSLTVHNEWAPLSLGLLVVAMNPYRPARELATLGFGSAVVMGLVVLVTAPVHDRVVPPIVFVIAQTLPLLALTAAATVYAGSVLSVLLRRDDGVMEAAAVAQRTADGDQERPSILEREVLPFFERVVATGVITDADREVAADVGGRLREVMVREADRTWLERVAESDRRLAAVDPRDAASQFTATQRAALRAFLVALADVRGFQRSTVVVTFDAGVQRGRILAEFNTKPSRHPLTPFSAVCRLVFDDFAVEERDRMLAIKFSYAHDGR